MNKNTNKMNENDKVNAMRTIAEWSDMEKSEEIRQNKIGDYFLVKTRLVRMRRKSGEAYTEHEYRETGKQIDAGQVVDWALKRLVPSKIADIIKTACKA